MSSSNQPETVERYDSRKNQLFLEKFSKTLLKNIVKHVADKVVLDAGCGLGWAEPILVRKGAKHIDAFDIDSEVIKYSQQQNIKNSIFEVRDFNKYGFKENYYDVVISIEVVEHLNKYEFYLSNLSKSLKKRGLLFLSTPNKKMSANLNPYHIKEFTVEEMTRTLEQNFLRLIKIDGLSANELSRIWAKFIPTKITSFVRKSWLYKILVDYFVKFPNTNIKEAETVLYLFEKI